MHKYPPHDHLVGISLGFWFEKMKENDTQFNELQLFENENNIHVQYKGERICADGKIYSIRIFSDLDKYAEVLGLIFDEIEVQFPHLKRLGLSEGISLEFFLEYHQEIQWIVHHDHLFKLNYLTNSFPAISLNSIDNSWDDEKDGQTQEVFYQLIFLSKNLEKDKEFILQKWAESYANKYESVESWNFDIRKGNGSKELILSLKDDLELFDWNETFTSLLDFHSKHAASFLNKNISVIYGFYQQNRTNMNGGEIEEKIVKELSKREIDLRFTLSQKAP